MKSQICKFVKEDEGSRAMYVSDLRRRVDKEKPVIVTPFNHNINYDPALVHIQKFPFIFADIQSTVQVGMKKYGIQKKLVKISNSKKLNWS